jgi:hypothetical protein
MRAVARGAYRQRQGAHSQRVARLPYEVFGFRQWDRVALPDGRVGFVKGRRSRGYFDICDVEGQLIGSSISYRRLRLVGRARTLLTETRKAAACPNQGLL